MHQDTQYPQHNWEALKLKTSHMIIQRDEINKHQH